MVSCVSCGTSKTPDNKKKGISFHRFPKNVAVREQWLKFVGAQRHISENAVLCSKHFSPECFDRTSQAVTRLKISAIPTIRVNRLKCVRKLNPETLVPSSSPNMEASSTSEVQFMVGPVSSPVAEAAGPPRVFLVTQSDSYEREPSCSVAGQSNVNPTMGEGITEDAFEVTKQPAIIKEARKEVAKQDLMICGQCHKVFFFVEQFSEHKTTDKCQKSSEVGKICEGESKAQIWAFNLWKQTQQRVKSDSDNSNQNPWAYYQRWCKLAPAERELWVKAGESLMWQDKMMSVKLKELWKIGAVSPVKDPLALDDVVTAQEVETNSEPSNAALTQEEKETVGIKREDVKDTKPSIADKSAVRTTTEPTQEQQFVVERILAKRFTLEQKTWEYKIKWENFPEEESTWEPLAHLRTCKGLIDEFEENLQKLTVEKTKQATAAIASPPSRGRDTLRSTAQALSSVISNSSIEEAFGGRPQTSSKQKTLHQVNEWCGNVSDADGGTSGIKRPYEDDSSNDSLGKKLKLDGDESEDSEDELEKKSITPKKTVPKATIINNGIGTKLPDNILIPDDKGVVRIKQKQLPSLSSGVYIMSKTGDIIKLDSAASKMATSAGQAIIKVAPKTGQAHIKVVKTDGDTASEVIPMQKASLSKVQAMVKQQSRAASKVGSVTSKVKKVVNQEKQKAAASDVTEKAMEDLTGEGKSTEEKAQQSDSEWDVEELEFPADLPLPERESPPGDFVLDPVTGKIAGQEYPDPQPEPESPPGHFVLDPVTGKIAGQEYPDPQPEPEITPAPDETASTQADTDTNTDMDDGVVADTSLENLLKLAPTDITEDDLQPQIQLKREARTVAVQRHKPAAVDKVTVIKQTLEGATAAPLPKIQQRALNQSAAPRQSPFVVRTVAMPRKVIPAPKPKFQTFSQLRTICESPRMQYASKPALPGRIGSTSIYKGVANTRKKLIRPPIKWVSTVYHSSASSWRGSPVTTHKIVQPGMYRQSSVLKTKVKKVQQTMYRTPPKKEPVFRSSTLSPRKPKPIITKPSLSAVEESVLHASVASSECQETLAYNEPPIFLTEEDGTVYQVAGQDEQGQTILITQDANGQQQCFLATNESAAEEVQPADTDAATSAAMSFDVDELLSIETTHETQQDQVIAQVVRTEPPSPGGTHRVVVMLPDGNLMVTQVTPEEYASLDLDK